MRRAILIVTLLTGCGPNNYADYNKQLVQLYCQHEIDCGFADSSYLAACEQSFSMAMVYDPATLKVSYSQSAGESCLKALSHALGADCVYGAVLNGSFDVGTACDNVVSGTVNTGGSCKTGVECVTGDDCAFQSTGPMMCTATCQPSTFTVGMLGDVGTICKGQMGTNLPCRPGLSCIPSADYMSGTCGTPPGAGSPCLNNGSTNRTCASGLVCDPTSATPVCIAEKQMGQPCNAADECAPRLACVGPTTGTALGTCQSLLPAGAKCPASSINPCMLPSQCNNNFVCAPPPMVGQPCNNNCLDGYCDFTATPSVCKAFIPVGGACNPNAGLAQCAGSATCNATTMTCVANSFCM
jgi:hypothetical protein